MCPHSEANMWEKRTLWENAAHVPLIMRVPWMAASLGGKRTAALVELVDLYRTLCELLAVPLPSDDTHPVEGTSLVPLLQDPSGAGWGKRVALTQYPRCPRNLDPRMDWQHNSCIHTTERTDFGWMGYSMMVDHTDGCAYRFTMWPRWNGSALAPIWSDVHAVELYNHSAPLPTGVTSQFDAFESVNLANGGRPYWEPPRDGEAPPHAVLVAALTRTLKTSFGFAADAS